VDLSGKLRLFRFGHRMRPVLLFPFQVAMANFLALFEGKLSSYNSFFDTFVEGRKRLRDKKKKEIERN